MSYEIYLLRGGYSGPTDGIKLAEGTKHFKYGGYHRIELGKQYRAILSKKQNYSVIVREKDSEGKSYYPFIDTFNEQRSREWSLAYYGKTVINPGESYLYDDGKWQDLSDGKLQASIIRQKEKIIPGDPQTGWTMDNFPIKAYGETVKIGENYFTGYLVSYRMQGRKKWATKTMKASATKKILSGLKSGRKYQVRVRGFIKTGGKIHYGAWSSILKKVSK